MENNKLIAEFMGFPTQSDAIDERTLAYYIGDSIINADNTNNENEDNVFHPDDMKFNSSWDWLMPVVEECFFNQDEVSGNLSFKLNDALLEINLDSLYKVVIEFIYELQKKKQKL